jgi:hypothetical protein
VKRGGKHCLLMVSHDIIMFGEELAKHDDEAWAMVLDKV